MFLYKPETDEQKEGLILVYQLIIDNSINGFINLLFSDSHYRYYFVDQHQNNHTWNKLLRWSDDLDIAKFMPGRVLLFTLVFSVFSYFAFCWVFYALKIMINYKKIRREAPLNLLKLG